MKTTVQDFRFSFQQAMFRKNVDESKVHREVQTDPTQPASKSTEVSG